jgi:hypothetical protein
MKEDERTILLMAHGPFFFGRVISTNVHESEGVVGIFDGSVVVFQSKPRDPSVIKLNKFAVRLEALVFGHHKFGVIFFDVEHRVQKRGETIWTGAIWSAIGFHLENP